MGSGGTARLLNSNGGEAALNEGAGEGNGRRLIEG
jgi:hypothetical protein